jgi:hypothetical protein
MKTYIKPVVEVKEFNVMNNIASLDTFLGEQTIDGVVASTVITAANITSYSAVS